MTTESRPRVAIVDYQLANMFSVERACAHVGLDPIITSEAAVIASADAIVLPGVGAFGEAMANLRRLDLIGPITDFIATSRPFLGICLGMQLLFSESEEFGASEGLGVIPGRVIRFPDARPDGQVIRVPQIGWNRISPPSNRSWNGTLLATTPPGEHMYFLHSFYTIPSDPSHVLCETDYEGIRYASGVASGNIVGLQFHPEKSAARGMDIYTSFAGLISAADIETR